MSSGRLPTLFVSHGSPLFALEPGMTGPALSQWAGALRATHPVRAVLVMSPHWMDDAAQVGSHPMPPTWHDFGGFPPALYRLDYPAPGDPALADRVTDLLQVAGIPSSTDGARPRDHGVWVPLTYLVPRADVPVVQLALPQSAGPAEVLAIGRALAPLRQEGVLVVGSGSLTHNLHELFASGRPPMAAAPVAPYAEEFVGWIVDAIAHGDEAALCDYRARAPHAERAHPTDEHLLPLYFALGAGGWPRAQVQVQSISDAFVYGTLSMAAFAIENTIE